MRATILCIATITSTRVECLSTNNFRITTRTRLGASSYGRGAEIWPECNEKQVQLADSFPGGTLPSEVSESLYQNEEQSVELDAVEKKSYLPRPIRLILSRAAGAQERRNNGMALDKAPPVIATTLILSGLVRPLDVMITAGISGYLTVLYYWAQSPRSDGISPHVPSLPPQGHLPDLVVNPLGPSFTNSKAYDLWLKIGVILSLFAPILMILHIAVLSGRGSAQIESAKVCARPLFLLCSQAFVESIARGVMVSSAKSCTFLQCPLVHVAIVSDALGLTPLIPIQAPLPIRILVPVAFNAVRLAPLWIWATAPLSMIGRILALSNFVYWSANLFAFLIPTASLRYMRAYFFCVEAEQVTTRFGFENSVGLLP